MCIYYKCGSVCVKTNISLFQDVSGSFNPLEGLDKTKSQGWYRTQNLLVQKEYFELSQMILKAKINAL